MMFGSWDMEHNRNNFLSLLVMFCPFTPLTNQKIRILQKWEKTPGDIIILHSYTTNGNHMMYGSWDMECDRHNFFVILDYFLPFFPLITQKIKILKKWKKKHLEISFYTSSQSAIKKSDTQDFCINQSCWLSRTTTWICWAILFIRNFLYWRQQKIENLISQEIEVVWRCETPQNCHKTEVLGNFKKNLTVWSTWIS